MVNLLMEFWTRPLAILFTCAAMAAVIIGTRSLKRGGRVASITVAALVIVPTGVTLALMYPTSWGVIDTDSSGIPQGALYVGLGLILSIVILLLLLSTIFTSIRRHALRKRP